jgi:hypothetical protein
MSVVYNQTIHAAHGIREAWLYWLTAEYIPAVMDSKQFTEYRFFHLLEQDEMEGITYVLQFIAPSISHYQKYMEEFEPWIRKKAADKWGNRMIAFSTIMEVMH